ncbi:MAG: hypothetical protein IPM29_08850 [Planctomycetes bacterium]|nr:hypothetical protein [Planctomycetota bacterium]
MISLLFRLFPYLLATVAAFMTIAAIATLAGDPETAPERVTIEQLEAGSVPAQSWIEVADGVAYWPEAVEQVRERRNGSDSKLEAVFVPIVSRVLADAWEAAQDAGRPVPYTDCRLVASLSAREYESIKAGQAEANSGPAPFVVSGERGLVSGLSAKVLAAMRDGTTDLVPERIMLVDFGSKPLQKDQAGVMLFVGLGLLTVGLLWIRARRRPGARNSVLRAAA